MTLLFYRSTCTLYQLRRVRCHINIYVLGVSNYPCVYAQVWNCFNGFVFFILFFHFLLLHYIS